MEPYAVTNDRGFIRQNEAHDEFGYMKDVDRKAYNIVMPNSFAYNPARINVGSIGYYEGAENVIVSSLYEVFQTADYVDDRFLWHWFKSDIFPKWIERLQEGSVRLYFYYDKLCECKMLMPSLPEQKKIAATLDEIDNLITLHQCKYNQYHTSVFDAKTSSDSVCFTATWEQRKLPEFVTFYNGLTYTPDDVRDEGTLVLRSSNVKNGSVVDADNIYVDPNRANSENVKDGDIIVVVRNGSRALIGKHAEIKGTMPNTVIGAFMTGIRSDYPSFVNALLDTPQFDKEIEKNMGATINQITGYMFSKMEFYIPSSPDEQKQIGALFTSLDDAITLHQRKCEETKDLKKYMLKKMFPQNGTAFPEIRFSGFTDAWEQRKFSELYEKVTEKNDLSFGTDKIISVANMYYKEDTSKSDDDYMRTYNVMRLGDIAFEGNKSKNYAHGRFVENTIGDGIVSHVFDVFRPISEYDLLFWKYLINYEGVMGKIMVRCTKASTMMTNLVANDFLKESISVPCIEEQRKIGAFLEQLDNLITLHQRKCDELKNIKKYMLQNMFPQKG